MEESGDIFMIQEIPKEEWNKYKVKIQELYDGLGKNDKNYIQNAKGDFCLKGIEVFLFCIEDGIFMDVNGTLFQNFLKLITEKPDDLMGALILKASIIEAAENSLNKLIKILSDEKAENNKLINGLKNIDPVIRVGG